MEVPYQRLGDVLTRIDELLVLLLRVEEEQLKLLQLLAGVPVPISPATRERIIERYEAGATVTEIARELYTSETVVREVIERTERIVAPAPVEPERLEELRGIHTQARAIHDMLDRVEEILKPVTDYLSEEKSAPKSPARLEYKLKKEIQRYALNGYIANGGPGDLEVKINRLKTIRVANGEVLDFNYYYKRPLEIKYVELTTPTTATFRILLW